MSDLIEELVKNGHEFDFFQTLLLLEEYCRKINSYIEWYNQIRLSASPDISFPASDISSIDKKRDQITIYLSFMGLMGVSSPLPNYFSEFGARNSEEHCALNDLLNIFSNRIYYLFSLAWKKYRPVSTEINDNFYYQYSKALNCVKEKSEDLMADEKVLMSYSGMFSGAPRNADCLIEILSDLFVGVKISIEKWNLRWVKVDCLGKLGYDLVLGDNSILGERMADRSGKFLIILGLNKTHSLRLFNIGSSSITSLKKIADAYLQNFMEYDILIKFTSANMIPAILGKNNTMLGTDATYGGFGSNVSEYTMLISWNSLNKMEKMF